MRPKPFEAYLRTSRLDKGLGPQPGHSCSDGSCFIATSPSKNSLLPRRGGDALSEGQRFVPLGKGDYRGCAPNQRRPPAARSATSPLEEGDKRRHSTGSDVSLPTKRPHEAALQISSQINELLQIEDSVCHIFPNFSALENLFGSRLVKIC